MKRPTTFAGLPQLETLAQAEAENLRRIDALTDREPDIAAALEACGRKARCGLVICAVDARAFRFRKIHRAARHREVISGPARNRAHLP